MEVVVEVVVEEVVVVVGVELEGKLSDVNVSLYIIQTFQELLLKFKSIFELNHLAVRLKCS